MLSLTVTDSRKKGKTASKKKGNTASKKKGKITDYLRALEKKIVLPTRYPDWNLLHHLGIKDDVLSILENIGLKNILLKKPRTYIELTRQFLASAEMKQVVVGDNVQWKLYFTVKSCIYELKMDEICHIFGFPSGEDGQPKHRLIKTTEDQSNELSRLWDIIGTGEYKAASIKSCHIRNPALRYVHKILAHSFFARQGTGYIREEELLLLIKGIHPFLKDVLGEDDLIGIGKINMGCILGHNLAGYKHLALRNPGGILSVGGMVTPILEHFKIELGAPLQQERIIDRQNLNKKFIIAKFKESYVYQFVDRVGHASSILLPNVALTSIQTFCNLEFDISQEFLYRPALAHQPDHSSWSCLPDAPTLLLQGSAPIDPDLTAEIERLKKTVSLQQQVMNEMGEELEETKKMVIKLDKKLSCFVEENENVNAGPFSTEHGNGEERDLVEFSGEVQKKRRQQVSFATSSVGEEERSLVEEERDLVEFSGEVQKKRRKQVSFATNSVGEEERSLVEKERANLERKLRRGSRVKTKNVRAQSPTVQEKKNNPKQKKKTN